MRTRVVCYNQNASILDHLKIYSLVVLTFWRTSHPLKSRSAVFESRLGGGDVRDKGGAGPLSKAHSTIR